MGTSEWREQLVECRAALRATALELSRAEDDVRARIARGLHDDLGQTLATVQLRLGELDHAATAESRRTIVEGISDLIDEAVGVVRTLTFELRAPMTPEVGIEGELESFSTALTERDGIACRFDSDSEPKPVSPEVAAALLRVARELLRNIAKHSRADKASVVVARDGDRIRLTVSDDGAGLRRREPSAPERYGVGLLIVQERLAEIGGDIDIGSGKNSGTRIVVTAPLLGSEAGTP